MSDQPQGPDWWQASDGKWYPPQGDAGATPPPPSSAVPPPEKKKRRGCVPILIGAGVVVVIIVVVAVVAGGGSNDDNKTSSKDSTAATVSKGVGSADVSADVSNVTIAPADAIGIRYVTASITNHSSKRSDYLISVNVESPDGKTKYGDATILEQNVEPGQTVESKGLVTSQNVPPDAVAKLNEVQRTASTGTKGLGSADVSGDVSNVTIAPPDAIGVRYVTASIKNNSSKRSDYLISMNVESPDGKTKYDTATILEQKLEPGQTVEGKGLLTSQNVPADAVAKVKEVQRTASA